MADTNLPPEVVEYFKKLSDALGEVTYNFDEFGNELTEIQRKEQTRQRAIDARIQKEKAAADELASKISQVGRSIVSSASQMTSPDGAFAAIGNVAATMVQKVTGVLGGLPVIGGFIKGLGEAAAEAVKVLTSTTQNALNVFNKISQSGVVTSFTDMRDAAAKTGLTYEQLDAALVKNSEQLAMLGGSALAGSKSLQNVLKTNKDFAENFQKMGVSFQEFAEIQSNYTAMQARSGFARGKSDQALAEGARAYAENLAILNKLTGKSRETLQREQAKLLSDARFRSRLALMRSQNLEKEADIAARAILSLPAELQEGAKDMFAGSGAVATKAAGQFALAIGIGGEDASTLTAQLGRSGASLEQFLTAIGRAGVQYEKTMPGLVAYTGATNDAAAAAVGMYDAASQFGGRDIKQILGTLQQNQKDQMTAGDSFAYAANQAQQLASRMQLTLTASDGFIKALGHMTKAVNTLLKETGLGPATSGAEVAAAQAAAGARPAIAETAGGAAMVGQTSGRRRSSAGGPEVPAARAIGAQKPRLATVTSKSGNTAQVGENYAPAFQSLVNYLDDSGYSIYSMGGYNDRDVTGQPGVKSIHAYGGAIDINPATNPYGSSLITDMPSDIGAVARKLGLGWGGNWSSVKDAMHFSAATSEGGSLLKARTGALVQPRSGGSLVQVAEAGQPEAIIPMADGRSVPVSLRNASDIVNRLDTQNMLLSQVVMLLGKGNRIQGNIAANFA